MSTKSVVATKAYRKLVDKSFPGLVMEYFYITKYDGVDWVADIESESAEGWGDAFEWDNEPCGHGIKSEEIADYLKDADEIGYIQDGKLTITKRWQVPTAYGYKQDMTPFVSTWEWVGEMGES